MRDISKKSGWQMPREIELLGTAHSIIGEIGRGMTSRVFRTSNGEVIKQYFRDVSQGQFQRETNWLKRLSKLDIAPALLGHDEQTRTIHMSDCGEPISRDNAPADWETQLKSILGRLRQEGCAHNDLSEQEVLVKDGKLRVADFAFASHLPRTDMPITERSSKTRYFLDESAVEFVRFKLYGAPPGSEPHCVVLWDIGDHARVRSRLSERFVLVREIVYTPKIFSNDGSKRKLILDQFYCGRPSWHGDKGKKPFILYFILDPSPRYEERRHDTRRISAIVNVNVYDLKNLLRGGRAGYLHGSDNIQESFDNLEALSIYEAREPVSYWMQWRPSFATVSDFFERLNGAHGLLYLVLRNYNSLAENSLEEGADIDILVNDYFLFKRVTGAIGYKHKRAVRPGPAYEYGGYKVAGWVRIGGREVSVDIRYVGSCYYDASWERAMLANRVRHASFFVPGPEDRFYSLLYHALVHKRQLDERYRDRLRGMNADMNFGENLVDSDDVLWTELDTFMRKKGYSYVRPNERSILLSAAAKARIGISAEADLSAARDLMRAHRFHEAMDLLLSVMADAPSNRMAKGLLLEARAMTEKPGFVHDFMRRAGNTKLGRMLPNSLKAVLRKGVLTYVRRLGVK